MIYVCGDSFAAGDPESKIKPWHEQLTCTNLARTGATNTQISQQVDHALENASFIVVLFTTCTRFEYGPNDYYTLHNVARSNLTKIQQDIVTEHAKHFFDLELEIYKNKCIIESVLQRLVDSEIPFLFDQGGFEHPKFGVLEKYFEKYSAYRSEYNLWDWGDSKVYRPYFHITDQNVHNKIADYYRKQTL